MNGTAVINDGIIEAIMKSVLYEEMKKEVESAPSENELAEMFPETKKERRFLHRYEKREARREKRMREPAPAALHFKRAAVVLMAVISAFSFMLMTSTEVRAAVEHTIVQFFDKYAKVNFSYSEDNGDEDIDDIYKLKIGYIPEGYELIETDETEENRWYTYYNSSEDLYLSIDLDNTALTESDIDNEHHKISEITIGRYNGYLFYNEEEQEGIIIVGNKRITISVGGYFGKDELIKIAKNIK